MPFIFNFPTQSGYVSRFLVMLIPYISFIFNNLIARYVVASLQYQN